MDKEYKFCGSCNRHIVDDNFLTVYNWNGKEMFHKTAQDCSSASYTNTKPAYIKSIKSRTVTQVVTAAQYEGMVRSDW